MAFLYTDELVNEALTYSKYRKGIDENLVQPAKDETAERMRAYTQNNVALMQQYDDSYSVSDSLKLAIEHAPATTWLVISEGWCGDAAYNVPMLALIEKLAPQHVQLRIVLRDNNTALMDANLTDGGRSIPKLIVLSKELKELGTWGPRPAGLQTLMKNWNGEGLTIMELIPRVQEWYDTDNTKSLQEELMTLVKSYS